MNVVKIVSDPYRGSIAFETLEGSKWVPVTAATAPHAKLLQRDIVTGFFPFKARAIIDILIKEYGTTGDKLTVVFEGTSEEYHDIEALCETEYENQVILQRSPSYLTDASEAVALMGNELESLKDIRDTNGLGNSSFDQSIERLGKCLADGLSLCVVGRRKEGTHRFVNALIGHELLPETLPPTVALLVEDSPDSHCGSIDFLLDDERLTVEFDDFGFRTISRTDALGQKIESIILDRIQDIHQGSPSLYTYLFLCLSAICSESENIQPNSGVCSTEGSIIRIEVPFESSADHGIQHCSRIVMMPESLQVLDSEAGLASFNLIDESTCALPIFVSTIESLGSDYYMDLLGSIRRSKSLDLRFAMIVIDETDWSDLPKTTGRRFEAAILNRPLPKAVGGQGVFFTSTLMGLGSKTNGSFMDCDDAERYRELIASYDGSSANGCIHLYDFNIQPDVMKARSDQFAQSLPNSIGVNCGLASIQYTIEAYRTLYAPYRSCEQFATLLGETVSDEEAKADDAKWSLFQSRYLLEQDIARIEEETKCELGDCERDCWWTAFHDFSDAVRGEIDWDAWENSLEELTSSYTDLLHEIIEKNDIEGHDRDAQEAAANVSDRFLRRIQNASDDQDFVSFAKAFPKLFYDVSEALNQANSLRALKSDTASETADVLFDRFVDTYRQTADKAQKYISQISQVYWQSHAWNLEQRFAALLRAEDTEHRMRLASLYPNLDFPELDYSIDIRDFATRDNFVVGIHVLGMHIPTSENLDLQLLDETYDRQMHEFIEECIGQAKVKHGDAFSKWAYSYLDNVLDNLKAIDSDLSKKTHEVDAIGAEIERRSECSKQLNALVTSVSACLDWQGR